MTDKKGIILYENEQAKIHLKQVLCFNNFVKFNLCYPRTYNIYRIITHTCVCVWKARKISVILESSVRVYPFAADVQWRSQSVKCSQMEPAAERSTMAATLPQSPFPTVCPPFDTVPVLVSFDVWLILSFSMALNCFLAPSPSPSLSPSQTIQLQSQNAQRKV